MFYSFEKALDLMLSPLTAMWLLMTISLFAQLCKRFRIAKAANLTAVAILWVTGTSIVSNELARTFEMQNLPIGEIPQVDAIVVLGGVTGRAYPPQPVVHVGPGGDRLLYATALYKEGRAPLVVFSGNRFESAEMAEVMEMMGVPRTAMLEQDTALQNTYGAARDLKRALISHKVRRVLVVTSAIRMPRALAVFRRLGISAIPAPTDFITRTDPAKQPADFAAAVLPNMGSLGVSTAAIHEFVGLVAYSLAGWI